MKKKSKKKKIIIIVAIALVVVIGAYMMMPKGAPIILPTQSEQLQKTSVASSVSTDGNVESTDAINVYADLTYPVENIPVRVGDHVEAGDVLCQLKTDELEEAIQKGESDLAASSASANQQIKVSQKKYADEKKLLDEGLNTQLNSAEDSVVRAKADLDAALRSLDKAKTDQAAAKKDLDDNLNAELISARAAADSAKTAYDRARSAYLDRYNEQNDDYKKLKKDVSDQEKLVRSCENAVQKARQALLADPGNTTLQAKVASAESDLADAQTKLLRLKQDLADYESDDSAYDPDDPTRQSLKQLRQAMEDAEAAYATATKNLQSAQNSINQKLNEYELGVTNAQATYDQAKTAYDSAVKSQKAAQLGVSQGLSDAQQAIESSRLAANNESAKLALDAQKKDLDNCTMRAPAAGTITAVYAVKGAPANGLMFVIEDTEALQLTVQIKEYDVNIVKPGMKCVIKAEATGDAEYEGYLDRIAPAAVKEAVDASKNSNGGGSKDVVYEATILVTSKNTDLRIGMSARADIITEQKDNVFAVPYDALSTDAQGQDIIYTAKQQEDGSYLPEAIPISTGIETDSQIEISGDGLSEGMLVLSDGKQVIPGMPIQLAAVGNGAAEPLQPAEGGAAG